MKIKISTARPVAKPMNRRRLSGQVSQIADWQLRRICILHAQPADCEAKDHEEGEELRKGSPKDAAERILVATHIFLSRSLLSSDLR